MIDVVIAGGGPAGAAAALALRAHAPALSVAVLEASAYSTPRIAETLHPAARPLLERLGLWERFAAESHLEAGHTGGGWGSPVLGGEQFIASGLGRGFPLDRRRFDAMLLQEATARGVQVRSGCQLTRVEQRDGAFQIELFNGDAAQRLDAAFVIDATGRRARLASSFGIRRVFFDRLVAALVFFDVDEGRFPGTGTSIEAVEDGWWYTARLPGSGAVAALMTDADIAARRRLREPDAWRRALAATTRTAERLAAARPRGAPALHPAGSSALSQVAGEGWLAIGDAAVTVDPLSGQGIQKALHHGVLSSYAVADYLAKRSGAASRFQARIDAEVESYLEAYERYYREETRWLDAPFWSRRRPNVHLPPTARLAFARLDDIRSLTMHLPSRELEQLAALCGKGRCAHDVVSASRRAGIVASDRRVVLALQYLIDEGAVQLVDPPRDAAPATLASR